MGKYLHDFKTEENYNEYVNGSEYTEPFVGTFSDEVKYNKD